MVTKKIKIKKEFYKEESGKRVAQTCKHIIIYYSKISTGERRHLEEITARRFLKVWYTYIFSGKELPLYSGYFVITTPHHTFRSPGHLTVHHDPFPRLEEVTMEQEDVLLVARPKSGS